LDILFVPLSVDALRLATPKKVLGPLARLDRLPWQDGKHCHNPDMPWLGAALKRPPFAEPDTILSTGVHLHWTLPDGLARGRIDRSFPIVPDRWLVTRPGASWVVESDYADVSGRPVAPGQTLFPKMAEGGAQPWQAHGRQLRFDDWLSARNAPTRVPPTAMGYGDPLFAAYYPTCRSMFGLYDPDPPPGDLTYDVIGWYSQHAEDPLAANINVADVKEQLAWIIPGKAAGGTPDRAVFYGRLRIAGKSVSTPRSAPIIAIANSGPQALGALSAAPLRTQADRFAVEASVASLQHADALVHLEADHAQTLEAEVHEHGFVAEAGGRLWALRPLVETMEPAKSDPSKPTELRIPPTLAELLLSVNSAQLEYNATERELDDARTQLMADWSKYLMLLYPQRDQAASPIDPAEVRSFIEREGVASITELETSLGDLNIQGADLDGFVDPTPVQNQSVLSDTKADQVIGAMRPLFAAIETYNTTGISGRTIGKTSLNAGVIMFDGATRLTPDQIEGWSAHHSVMHPIPSGSFTLFLRMTCDQSGSVVKCGPEITLSVDANLIPVLQINDSTLTANIALQSGVLTDVAVTYDAVKGEWFFWIGGATAGKGKIDNAPLPRLGRIGTDIVLAPEPNSGGSVFKGGVARFVMVPGIAKSASEIIDLIAKKRPPSLGLAEDRAQRFWRPRDPVIALKGPTAAATGRHGRGNLPTHVMSDPAFKYLSGTARADQAKARAALEAAIDGIFRANPQDTGRTTSNGSAWHPLAIEWETALHPMSSSGPLAGRHGRYAETYLTHAFSLQPDGPDLIPRPQVIALSETAAFTEGRSILTPFADTLLKKRAKAAKDNGVDLTALPSAALDDHSDVQSQALNGFHAALLQMRQAMSVPPDDPLALPSGQSNTGNDARDLARKTVAQAVYGSDNHVPITVSAARPNQPFVPMRAGRLEMRRMRLIDAFGQVQEIDPRLDAKAQVVSQHPAADNDIYMPPRLAQPARLNFRWLSAASGQQEAGDHVNASPVCGWLVCNALDNAIAVYDNAGVPLGQVAPDAPNGWMAPPGAAGQQPEQFENIGLAHVVRRLITQGQKTTEALTDAIFSALNHVLPPMGGVQPALSLLTGRPLAVVRAKLDLEMHGQLAVDQSWPAFIRDVRRRTRDTGGIDEIRCPLRLGEGGRMDDGLVGFWREDSDHRPVGDFHVPAFGPKDVRGPGIAGPDSDDAQLELRPSGTPEFVAMLIDPLGKVHATCGLVPVKAIDIPRQHYEQALNDIQTWTSAAPILTPDGPIEVPLPKIGGRTWSWTEQDPTGSWVSVGSAGLRQPGTDAKFTKSKTLKEGWLLLSKEPRQ
jgi:hypothetical protein